MFEFGGSRQTVQLVLYTDAFIIRGTLETRQRRVTDMLNDSSDPFLVLSDVTVDEFGPHGATTTAEHAQINLGSVLFAVADTVIEPVAELRTPKVAEVAMIAIPPFRVTGSIHLLPERDLGSALSELHGTFVPVTNATYWSDPLGEARATAALVAVNHARAQILAPHREVDPWAGLDRSGSETASGGSPTADPWAGDPTP